MNIYLVPNFSKNAALEVARQAVDILLEEGAAVLLEEPFAKYFAPAPGIRFLTAQQAMEACDIVLTIGGDGTLLRAARQGLHCPKPLVGINMGRLGFLTIIENDELYKLRRLPKREYQVEQRSVLQANFGGANSAACFAFNDIVLFKQVPNKTISMDIYCDDCKVSSFRGDGIIFATSTGSTAYSMSAGGPILDARLGGIIATQICAHIVHTPPMVFASDRILRAVPQSPPEDEVYISCDGQESWQLPWKEEIIIRQAGLTVPVIEFEDAGQLKSIDKKLKGR
ncbi:MAG: NAD(+)/NADH kinase [Oscillospiraceae bacterium]